MLCQGLVDALYGLCCNAWHTIAVRCDTFVSYIYHWSLKLLSWCLIVMKSITTIKVKALFVCDFFRSVFSCSRQVKAYMFLHTFIIITLVLTIWNATKRIWVNKTLTCYCRIREESICTTQKRITSSFGSRFQLQGLSIRTSFSGIEIQTANGSDPTNTPLWTSARLSLLSLHSWRSQSIDTVNSVHGRHFALVQMGDWGLVTKLRWGGDGVRSGLNWGWQTAAFPNWSQKEVKKQTKRRLTFQAGSGFGGTNRRRVHLTPHPSPKERQKNRGTSVKIILRKLQVIARSVS